MAMSALPILATTAGAAAAAWVARGVFWPRAQLFGRTIFRGSRDDPPLVALTFDDGPHPEATDAILGILRQYDVPAAFFVVGSNVIRWPDVLRRIDAAGHTIGNHTFDHAYHGIIRGPRYWREQVAKTDEAIEQTIGRRTTLFRPPMGFKSLPIKWAVKRHGHRVVTWSRRARDGVRTTSERIIDRVSDAAAGDIILLHDGVAPGKHRDPTPTVEALPRVIETLRERGLSFVSLEGFDARDSAASGLGP